MAHFAADWLRDKLAGKFPKDLNRKIRIPLNGLAHTVNSHALGAGETERRVSL